MKKIKIKKGRYYSNEWKPKFYCYSPTRITKTFIFTESCRYDLGTVDQLDVNKLFGIGLGLNHHKNSIRLGWRYDLYMNNIALYAYDYNDKDRSSRYIGSVKIGDEVNLSIRMNWKQNFYRIFVNGKESCNIQYDFPSKFNIKTKLGVYFGGNRECPHNMELIEK